MWVVENKAGEQLRITVEDVEHDSSHELGVDPGLVKDGVEAHLQALLAEHVELLGVGYTLVRREYMTAIGPVDLLCRDELGRSVAVEIKRRGEIDGVEQLTRYLDLLNRDSVLAPVSGVFAAQQIKPQARTLAMDRGIRCVTLDYDEMRGHGQRRVPVVLSCRSARRRHSAIDWRHAPASPRTPQTGAAAAAGVAAHRGGTRRLRLRGAAGRRGAGRQDLSLPGVRSRDQAGHSARGGVAGGAGRRPPSTIGGTGTRRAGPTGATASPTRKWS